jgi:hypothetical protein
MGNLHSYFSHSQNNIENFKNIMLPWETKGNKIFKNVKTHFMSMFDPLKRLMANYKQLFIIMQANQISTQM